MGFGAAKNIEFEWTVDYDKTLQTMRDYCYQNSIPIVIQVDKDAEYEDLVITYRGFKKHSFLEPATDTFDYLMPVSITSEGVESKLPHTAADIISFVMYLRSHYGKHYPEEYHKSPNIEFPPIKLDVHYDDVEDFHYSKGFDLEWGFYAANGKILDEPINDLTWLWDASLEFKSRNKRTPQK